MIIKKITAGVATVAALSALLSPVSAFANDSQNNWYEGNMNGAGSQNKQEVSVSSRVNVEQNSSTNSDTSVTTVNNTGGNSVEGTTGGDSSIRTGDATSKVVVINHGSSNSLDLNACNCQNQNHELSWTSGDNGWRSNNSLKSTSENRVDVSQDATTDSSTEVTSVNNTGDNEVEGSTSGNSGKYDWWFKKYHQNNNDNGDSKIESGDAFSSVMVHNYGSKNELKVH